MSKNTFIPTTKGLVSAHKSQDFTSDQKAQARTNIAAAASTHTHSADDIVSGALAKARQHAQTAYYDQAGTWAQTQTFNGSATPAMLDAGNASWFSDGATAKSVNNGREFLRLAFDSGIRGIGRDGANHHLLRVANVPGIDGDGTYDFAILGGSTLDFVSVPTDLDLVGNDIVDMVNIGNTLGSYSPRLIQGSTDSALTVGIATTLPGGALADRLVFSNNATVATATWSNTNVVMGNTLTVSNTLTVNESISCRYGISIKELATGNASWLLYRGDGGPTQALYLQDSANSRSHMYFTPAATDANASTHILSKLFVTQVADFGKGINATGPYPHGSFGVPGVISYEYPYTRNFAGDGSGYTWAVSKRSGGVTTDLFTIYDASGAVNIKGNDIHLEGSAGGWGSQYAFRGSSGTNRGGFGAVGTSDTLDYYWIGPSYSLPHVKINSSGTITKYTTTGFDGTYDSLIRYQALADIASPNKAHEIDGTIISSTASLNVVRIRPYSGGGSGAPVTAAIFRGDQSSEFMGNATFNGNVTATGTGNHQFGTGTAYSILANGAIINYIGNGGRFSIAEQWWMYKNDGDSNLYFRDMVNARMHAAFQIGSSSATANSYLYSNLNVEGNVGIGVSPTAQLDMSGGYLRIRGGSGGGTVPTNSKGLELTFDSTTNIGYVFAVSRDGAGAYPLSLGPTANPLYIAAAGDVTVNGPVTSTFSSSTSDLSTLDLSAGQTRLHKNTTTGEIRNWVNDGGVMKKSHVYN